MIRKYFVPMLALFSSSVFADTVSLGYAHTDLSHAADGSYNGFNVKYNKENIFDSVGVIGSITYGSGSDNQVKVKETSFLFGPSYRFNKYINTYAMIGISRHHYKIYETDFEINKKKNAFAYGIGVQINPVDNFAIDLSYQASNVKLGNPVVGKIYSDTLVLGVGYKF
ncbi:Ail/Lom family outer membrane beta-barrel protein [Photobacterium damselae]|uniref:Ail/Lom family outer membrane beta-barrel protein n=1 Tax=Photobacterium damselae TaxID=38293 RepID=UPI004068A1B8